jgi:hypothetical protein
MRILCTLFITVGVAIATLVPTQVARAAEYCVFTDPVYVAGMPVVPPTRYCVPAP